MAIIRRMDHFTVVTDRLDETRAFYELFGLEVGPRPDFPVDGLWFYADGRAILHIVAVATPPAPRRGVIDHIAFFGEDLAATLDRLDAHAIPFRLIRAPRPYSTWQVFFEDPNGAEVEIDFAPSEMLPAHRKSR